MTTDSELIEQLRKQYFRTPMPVIDRLCNEAADTLEQRNRELARLRERLEMYYTDDKGNRIECDSESMDGIACRDETIKLLDKNVSELREKLAQMLRNDDVIRSYVARLEAQLAGAREKVIEVKK